MGRQKLFIIITTACLLILVQTSIDCSAAESRFADEWTKVISELKGQTEKSDKLIIRKYKLAVAHANLGHIKKANNLFGKLKDKKWKKELKKLVDKYSAALKENPEDIKTVNYLGFAYYIDNQHKKAEGIFHKIINLDPKNIWSYNYLAVVQYELEKYNKAEKTLKKSMSIQKNPYTHFLLGVNYYKKGNLFKAIYHVGKGKEAANLFLNKD